MRASQVRQCMCVGALLFLALPFREDPEPPPPSIGKPIVIGTINGSDFPYRCNIQEASCVTVASSCTNWPGPGQPWGLSCPGGVAMSARVTRDWPWGLCVPNEGIVCTYYPWLSCARVDVFSLPNCQVLCDTIIVYVQNGCR